MTDSLHLICPRCQAINRLPADRLDQSPRCGQCHKVDTEAEPELGARFGIRSIPTLALFRGGREIARESGAMAVQDIVAWARAHL